MPRKPKAEKTPAVNPEAAAMTEARATQRSAKPKASQDAAKGRAKPAPKPSARKVAPSPSRRSQQAAVAAPEIARQAAPAVAPEAPVAELPAIVPAVVPMAAVVASVANEMPAAVDIRMAPVELPHDLVTRRAFELFVMRTSAGVPGTPDEDWFHAENDVRAHLAASA